MATFSVPYVVDGVNILPDDLMILVHAGEVPTHPVEALNPAVLPVSRANSAILRYVLYWVHDEELVIGRWQERVLVWILSF